MCLIVNCLTDLFMAYLFIYGYVYTYMRIDLPFNIYVHMYICIVYFCISLSLSLSLSRYMYIEYNQQLRALQPQPSECWNRSETCLDAVWDVGDIYIYICAQMTYIHIYAYVNPSMTVWLLVSAWCMRMIALLDVCLVLLHDHIA